MRTPLAIALACLAAAPVACGGDDEEAATTTTATTTSAATGATGATGSERRPPERKAGTATAPSDEHEIAEAIERVVGGEDPDGACAKLVTERYVRSAYGDAQGCRAAVSAQGSFEVAVEDVSAGSGSATATAVPAGGPNEGEDLAVKLVEEGGIWKVDYLRSDAPPGP